MDLCMAVMARCDTVVRACCQDLVELHLAIFMPCLRPPILEKTATTAATVIVGFVRGHIDKIFFAHNGFYRVSQVIRHRITEGFSHQLAWILDRKLDFEVLVPVGIYLESPFPDPFGIKLDDADDFKIVLDVEFFQSGPDCE